MKKILFLLLGTLFVLGCEKDPIVTPPVAIKPTIDFEGLSSDRPEIEYGQGITFKARTTYNSKITYEGNTGDVSNVVEIKLVEMTKDTTLNFTATNPDGVKITKSLTIKVLPPDPFFLKLIGVWRQTGVGQIYDFPQGDRSKPLTWRETNFSTTSCSGSMREVFTLDKKYLFLMNKDICGEFPKSAVTPFTISKPEKKLGIDMYYITHLGTPGNESNGAYEYWYFKSPDTLVMYQEMRTSPDITIARSFKQEYVLETKDYISFIKNNGDEHLLLSKPPTSSLANSSMKVSNMERGYGF